MADGSDKYEKEALQEIQKQLNIGVDTLKNRLIRSTATIADQIAAFTNATEPWHNWPKTLNHNFTTLVDNLMPLRDPFISLLQIFSILLCLMVIRWVWVALLEFIEGLHVYCFPEPNVNHPNCAPTVIEVNCANEFPCKPTDCMPMQCLSKPTSICMEETCVTGLCADYPIVSLDCTEEMPSCPIPIEPECPESANSAIQTVRTEERVATVAPQETFVSSSHRSSMRSSRTVGFEHSVKIRNAQRTEHIERTVVSN